MLLLFVVTQDPALPFLENSTVPLMSLSETLLVEFSISPRMSSG